MTTRRQEDFLNSLHESSRFQMHVMTFNMLTLSVKNAVLWGPADPYRFVVTACGLIADLNEGQNKAVWKSQGKSMVKAPSSSVKAV